MRTGVAVSVGCRGVAGNVGVLEGTAEGEAVTDGVETGSEVPQAAASKASSVNKQTSLFIRWILLLLAFICEYIFIGLPAAYGILISYKILN